MNRSLLTTKINIHNILFATDFSAGSMHAQPYATGIARRFYSKLFVAHVVVPDDYPSSFNSEEEAAQSACRDAELKMHALLESAAFANLECESAITHGDIWVGLRASLHRYEADLLVMGTVGRTGARKFLLGSIAEEAMREAHCPVLTVGPLNVIAEPVRFRHLLYATDFSAESLNAVPYAFTFAKQYSSRLILLHAIENLAEAPYLNAQMVRVRLADLAQSSGLSQAAETLVEMGSPGDVIVRIAEQTNADLIVIGARGAGSVARLATHFGSIAHKVVTHARCPVLTIRRLSVGHEEQ